MRAVPRLCISLMKLSSLTDFYAYPFLFLRILSAQTVITNLLIFLSCSFLLVAVWWRLSCSCRCFSTVGKSECSYALSGMSHFYAFVKPATFGVSNQIFRDSGMELLKTLNTWDVMGIPGRIGFLKKCMCVL